MKNLKEVIPEGFYKADAPSIVVQNVGELKKALSELPDDLPIEQGFDEGVRLVVYNIKQADVHLTFDEIED